MIRSYHVLRETALRGIVIYLLFLPIGLLLPGCAIKAEEKALLNKKPIVSKLNARDQIVVEFYGELIGPDDQPATRMVVDQVIIRDLKTKQSQRFVAEDADTLKDSFGYFKEVWSPDWEYLVLPLGRFHGFAIFSSKTVMEDLKNGRFTEMIRIDVAHDNAPRLWHKFVGWQQPHLFKFAAGRSRDHRDFVFNIDSREVHSKTATVGSYKAIIKGSELKIKRR